IPSSRLGLLMTSCIRLIWSGVDI
ncbi:helix-turn-helix transcriptional regulator, partial [Shigella flexneri]|nr:helix-turn-helix transcriptional regulator [Shigella boydii]EFW0539268.1 helix-turn-helix transcriptional regulator [Shigella boydii]EFW3003212.1 helix-turn-helix transcriptional regulator [Shigella flexneri]EFW7285832.1 helix-turn-helix transcriptional regulator [Shigella boydii]